MKDLGDVRVVVVVVPGVAPASGEASTSLEAGGVCPGDVLCPRGRIEREPGGVVGPRGDLPTLEGTILFLGAAEEVAAGEAEVLVAGEVLFGPGGVPLSPGEGLLVPVANACPAHVAAAGEGIVVVVFVVVVFVVVVFVVLDETVVGGVFPVLLPLLGRGVGDNGGQEVARLPATDALVVLVAVVVDDVAGYVFFSDPLLSALPELLGESCVVFSRVGDSRPGNSEGEGTPVVRELPGGLVQQVVLNKIDVAGTLVSPLVVGVKSAGPKGSRRCLAPPTPVSSSNPCPG